MKSSSTKGEIRLTKAVVPLRYDLELRPDLETFTFQGKEAVSVSLSKPAKEITLHAKELSVESASIVFQKQKMVATGIAYDEKRETVTFSFPKAVPAGRARLNVVFRGVLNDQMRGFYRSRYEWEGQEQYLATTQFEATDARRAFPCFDEPAKKAVFKVSLVVPEGLEAVSNTLPDRVAEHEAGYKVVHFAPTPKMSTYLLAFIVGKFEYVEKEADGVRIRVFTTPGKKHQAGFALECAAKTLKFFNEYFAIRYPLNTLDMIAVPDFASGAMENWGAVTYRESMILVDEEHSALVTRQWVALVIAHELSHQWFGNLVTMEWWTHLWLNEGFASYIEFLAVDHLFPEWNIWDQFVALDQSRALRLDALKHTHPIEVDVHDPDEIGEIFDAVSYSKGASIIRMLAEYLGEKDFRDGLRYYLKKHSYKNTETVHLWEAFEKVAKKPVRTFMRSWTRKSGHPVVSLERKGESLLVSQERFFLSPLSAGEANDATKWAIPFTVRTEEGTAAMLLEKKKGILPAPAGWAKGNDGEAGMYRTLYAPDLLAALHGPLSRQEFSPADRLGIIRDAFAFAEAGKMGIADLLSLLEAYEGETEYIVWSEIAGGLGTLQALFADEPWIEGFRAFARRLLARAVDLVGFSPVPEESHALTLLRSLVLGQAARFGNKAVIAQARSLFAGKEKAPIPADLRSVVYAAVSRHGTARDFKELKAMYSAAHMHEEKNRLGMALAAATDAKRLEAALSFSLSKHVRSQDAASIIAHAWSNPAGRELAWNFVQKEWKELERRYASGGRMLARVLSAASFVEKKHARDIRAFVKKHPVPAAARTVEQAIEKILARDAWRRRDKERVRKWLASRQYVA